MKPFKQLFVLLLLSLTFLCAENVMADKRIQDLTPNQYEENERKDNTEFLLEESLSEKRKAIPEEQKGLTFNQTSSDRMEAVQDQLFTQSNKMLNNSISSKAKAMNLFSKSTEDQFLILSDDVKQENTNTGLSMLYVVLIVLGSILILVLLIPGIWNKSKTS